MITDLTIILFSAGAAHLDVSSLVESVIIVFLQV
jgi:hypothetical protein